MWRRRLQELLKHEATAGMAMLMAAAVAMLLANSPLQGAYQHFVHAEFGSIGVHFLVNDVLMAVFFLSIGLELKQEMMEGFLSRRSDKILPLLAAAGGVAVPALIYLGINQGIAEHQRGWAIPTATDIAFAVCVLNLCGKHVPSAAKIFLLAIAIYDDLAAISIIALFFSHGLTLAPLLVAAGALACMLVLNRRGIAHLAPYLVLGGLMWWGVHAGGIHSTVAGMLTGLMIPMREHGKNSPSPLKKLQHRLHPLVQFLILPVFAFTNAGVTLTGLTPAMLLNPLPLGIALGLLLGKPLGIFTATFAAVKLGFADRPADTGWPILLGISTIAGIGFTMSLFINLLAFHSIALRQEAMIGIIAGSLLASVLGLIVTRAAAKR